MAHRGVIAGLVCTLAGCTPTTHEAEPLPRAAKVDVPVPKQPTAQAEPLLPKNLLAEHPRCLLETGCPKVPRFEPCPATLEPTSVGWLWRHHEELAGKPIAVRGVLEPGSRRCTMVGCRAKDGSDRRVCCNRCEASDVDLREEGGDGELWFSSSGIFCEGDESETCCSRDIDDVVIVQGRVSSYDPDHRGRRPGLLDATVCRVER